MSAPIESLHAMMAPARVQRFVASCRYLAVQESGALVAEGASGPTLGYLFSRGAVF